MRVMNAGIASHGGGASRCEDQKCEDHITSREGTGTRGKLFIAYAIRERESGRQRVLDGERIKEKRKREGDNTVDK